MCICSKEYIDLLLAGCFLIQPISGLCRLPAFVSSSGLKKFQNSLGIPYRKVNNTGSSQNHGSTNTTSRR